MPMDIRKRRAADGETPWLAGDLAGGQGSLGMRERFLPRPLHSHLMQTNRVPPSRPRFRTPTLTCRLLGQSGM